MTRISDEARKAAHDAAKARWVTGSSDTTQMLLSVDAALAAALPHLTDDGATDTPPAELPDVPASAAAVSATSTAAPSSHHREGATPAIDRERVLLLLDRHHVPLPYCEGLADDILSLIGGAR